MISRDKDDKLVIIYFYICDKSEELQFYCERFSNNSEPAFTDQEIMTLYLYAMHPEGHTKVKHIHNSTFPKGILQRSPWDLRGNIHNSTFFKKRLVLL